MFNKRMLSLFFFLKLKEEFFMSEVISLINLKGGVAYVKKYIMES